MELALLLFLGFLALPWYFMALMTFIFLADIALCEHAEFSWATTILVLGVGLTIGLGGGINPFMYVWNNFAEVLGFFCLYFVVGGLWSVAKWYFYLLKLRDQVQVTMVRPPGSGEDILRTADLKHIRKRPRSSYASENTGRILGWIGHWPFSMVGTFIGDFIQRIATNIYLVLSKLYDRMADRIFAGFEER